jgi:hypothetical protein
MGQNTSTITPFGRPLKAGEKILPGDMFVAYDGEISAVHPSITDTEYGAWIQTIIVRPANGGTSVSNAR